MKKSLSFAAPFLLSAALLLPYTAFAQAAGGFPKPDLTGLQSFVDAITGFINGTLVYLLGSIALVVFIWGVVKAYVLHGDSEEERKTGHQLILWGLIGFVVIFSVWGLVNFAQSLFGLSSGGKPPSYPTL